MKFINKNLAISLPLIVLSVFAVLVFIMPVVSLAQTQEPGKIHNPLGKTTSIPALIKSTLEGALVIGIPVVALAIIYCGFLFVFAMGNPEKLKKAKDALLYTLIGAAVLLGAWAIANLIVTTVKGLG